MYLSPFYTMGNDDYPVSGYVMDACKITDKGNADIDAVGQIY